MKTVDLPSGAILKISLASFEDSKALFQAILDEFRSLKIDDHAEVDVNLMKDLFCTGMASKKIELALKKCMEKAVYNDARVSKDTFEPEEARQDYMMVCFEVAQENIAPFMKTLMQQFSRVQAFLKQGPA